MKFQAVEAGVRQVRAEVPGPYTGIPLLLAYAPREGAYRGTILHYHGLTETKESYRALLTQYAKRGFLAVGVDALGHGERRAQEFDLETSRFANVLRWAEESAQEVPAILDALAGLVGRGIGRAAVSGVSFGGFIAFAAMVREPRLAALVSILGSPDLTDGGRLVAPPPAHSSPHHDAVKFALRPVLAINAALDQSVPPQQARGFVDGLRPLYAAHPERLAYHEFPGEGHFISDASWDLVWAKTHDWMERWLPA